MTCPELTGWQGRRGHTGFQVPRSFWIASRGRVYKNFSNVN